MPQPWEENQQWCEADLYFDFSRAVRVEKLDGSQHGLSHLMKSVDFLVEWEDQLWLIEVKDPENGSIPEQHRTERLLEFRANLIGDTLINEHLFPKLRDSLLYLGLDEGILNKPLRYLTIIAVESLEVAELEGLRNRLWQHAWVSGPPKRGWRKSFDVHAFNIGQWNRSFEGCPVIRISAVE